MWINEHKVGRGISLYNIQCGSYRIECFVPFRGNYIVLIFKIRCFRKVYRLNFAFIEFVVLNFWGYEYVDDDKING